VPATTGAFTAGFTYHFIVGSLAFTGWLNIFPSPDQLESLICNVQSGLIAVTNHTCPAFVQSSSFAPVSITIKSHTFAVSHGVINATLDFNVLLKCTLEPNAVATLFIAYQHCPPSVQSGMADTHAAGVADDCIRLVILAIWSERLIVPPELSHHSANFSF